MSTTKRKKKKGTATSSTDISSDDEVKELLSTMPLSHTVRDGDKTLIAQIFEPLLSSRDDDDKSGRSFHVIRLKQTLGERFTGGRSTPVFEIELRGTTGGETTAIHNLILKLVIQSRPSSSSSVSESSRTWRAYAMRVRSYEVEAGFYGRHRRRRDEPPRSREVPCPARALHKVGLHVPMLLSIERGGAHNVFSDGGGGGKNDAAAISFIMRDLRDTHPRHPETLSTSQTRAALDWLARAHARFWEAPKLVNEWAGRELWECGSFWAVKYRLERHAASMNGVREERGGGILESAWANTLRWLQRKYATVATASGIKLLGSRMDACRWGLHSVLHGDASASVNLSPVVFAPTKTASGGGKRRFGYESRRHRTLVHGDFKAANMFFAADETEDTHVACAVCDFQFAGPGFGAVDISYLLFPDARAHYDAGEEKALLDWYYERLGEHLVEMDKGDCREDYARDTLELHYRLAQVDFLAHCVGSGWVASAEPDAMLVRRVDETMAQFDDGEILGEEEYATAIRDAFTRQ